MITPVIAAFATAFDLVAHFLNLLPARHLGHAAFPLACQHDKPVRTFVDALIGPAQQAPDVPQAQEHQADAEEEEDRKSADRPRAPPMGMETRCLHGERDGKGLDRQTEEHQAERTEQRRLIHVDGPTEVMRLCYLVGLHRHVLHFPWFLPHIASSLLGLPHLHSSIGVRTTGITASRSNTCTIR
jgi:hypothetical protein